MTILKQYKNYHFENHSFIEIIMSEGLSIFLKEIEHYSYGERYRRW
jgi:hypothetical protein